MATLRCASLVDAMGFHGLATRPADQALSAPTSLIPLGVADLKREGSLRAPAIRGRLSFQRDFGH